tara:strand:+ start:2601 stop:3203 length:603 start_codon:yes stop_codon:yes gene_type:complete
MGDTIINDQYIFNQHDILQFYVVKISGKGNITKNDLRNVNLSANIYNSVKTIDTTISMLNIHNKPVLIVWDGDNYQGQDHQKPSPFTDIIFLLANNDNYQLVALKYKKDNTNPWKQKHLDTWYSMTFTKLYDTVEPHIIFNRVCDMYVSYGSTQFQYKDDDANRDETSGYSQLQEFKQIYNPQVIYNDENMGFEIYAKNQ